MVNNRFSNMLSIINAASQRGDTSCIIVSNKLCVNTLRLFRDFNFIFGFTFVSTRKGNKDIYPKIKVYLKYSESYINVFKNIKIVKQTYSNFILDKLKILPFNNNKRFLITTSKGLFLTNSLEYFAKKGKVKILASIII